MRSEFKIWLKTQKVAYLSSICTEYHLGGTSKDHSSWKSNQYRIEWNFNNALIDAAQNDICLLSSTVKLLTHIQLVISSNFRILFTCINKPGIRSGWSFELGDLVWNSNPQCCSIFHFFCFASPLQNRPVTVVPSHLSSPVVCLCLFWKDRNSWYWIMIICGKIKGQLLQTCTCTQPN